MDKSKELKIFEPDDILDIVHIDTPLEKKEFFRGDIKLRKGVMLTKEYVDNNREFVEAVARKISIYPDLYIDLIQPYNTKFKLAYFQRFTMRECSRKSKVYVTAPRAYSKTFLVILILYQICITRPGIKLFICAPKKEQGAKIFKEKLQDDIWIRFPFLKREIIGNGNFGQDYARLSFRNSSAFDCVSTLDTQRGGRRNTGLIDEVRR